MSPLSSKELMAKYGPFDYVSNKDGYVDIQGDWAKRNIVPLEHPLLMAVKNKKRGVHRDAHAAFTAVFDAIAAKGPPLSDLVRSWSGPCGARHIDFDPTRALSLHCFGVAIDINSRWNAYGAQPQLAGLRGIVRELVPIFKHFGFAWGGDFGCASVDGMHFELALK